MLSSIGKPNSPGVRGVSPGRGKGSTPRWEGFASVARRRILTKCYQEGVVCGVVDCWALNSPLTTTSASDWVTLHVVHCLRTQLTNGRDSSDVCRCLSLLLWCRQRETLKDSSLHVSWTELTGNELTQLHDAFTGHARVSATDVIGCSETRSSVGAQRVLDTSRPTPKMRVFTAEFANWG